MIDILNNHDWESAFNEANSNVTIAGPGGVTADGFSREDVKEIIGSAEGENDGADWIICGRLRDGRWFSLAAGCDYSGWDCQANGHASIAASREEIIRLGLSNDGRVRLGLSLT